MKNTALLKWWSPATPIRKPDNIISSRAREKNLLGFKPSYENEPHEKMGQLMSNAYMRIWFTERAVYEKFTYTREKIINEENKIKRRFVQRMMTYRKPTKNQFIEESIAKRKASGISSNQDSNPKNYERMKYKIESSHLDEVKKNTKKGPKGKETEEIIKRKNEITKDKIKEGGNGDHSNIVEAEIVCGCACHRQ